MKTRLIPPGLRLLGAVLAAASVLAACSSGANEAELLASARSYVEKQDYGAAVIQLKSALQKNPQSAEARLLLGRSLLDSGDAPGAAIELRKALELGAKATEVQPPLALAMLAQNQAQQVVQEFAAVTLEDPAASADLKSTVAAAYAALRQRDKALATVLSALKEQPQSTAALLLHARLRAADGDLPGALARVPLSAAATVSSSSKPAAVLPRATWPRANAARAVVACGFALAARVKAASAPARSPVCSSAWPASVRLLLSAAGESTMGRRMASALPGCPVRV